MTQLKIDNVEQVENVLNFWVFDEIRRLDEEQKQIVENLKEYTDCVNDINVTFIETYASNLSAINAQLKVLRNVASKLRKHVSFVEFGGLVQ